jgi:hypothetical protein
LHHALSLAAVDIIDGNAQLIFIGGTRQLVFFNVRQKMDLPLPTLDSNMILPEVISQDFIIKLGLNAMGMLKTLPGRSYYKKYLINFLARLNYYHSQFVSISSILLNCFLLNRDCKKDFSRIFDVSENYVDESLLIPLEENPLFTKRMEPKKENFSLKTKSENNSNQQAYKKPKLKVSNEFYHNSSEENINYSFNELNYENYYLSPAERRKQEKINEEKRFHEAMMKLIDS